MISWLFTAGRDAIDTSDCSCNDHSNARPRKLTHHRTVVLILYTRQDYYSSLYSDTSVYTYREGKTILVMIIVFYKLPPRLFTRLSELSFSHTPYIRARSLAIPLSHIILNVHPVSFICSTHFTKGNDYCNSCCYFFDKKKQLVLDDPHTLTHNSAHVNDAQRTVVSFRLTDIVLSWHNNWINLTHIPNALKS